MAGFPAAHKKVIDSQSLLASVPAFFFDSTNYSHPVRCGGAQWREGERRREREQEGEGEGEREREGEREKERLGFVLFSHARGTKHEALLNRRAVFLLCQPAPSTPVTHTHRPETQPAYTEPDIYWAPHTHTHTHTHTPTHTHTHTHTHTDTHTY